MSVGILTYVGWETESRFATEPTGGDGWIAWIAGHPFLLRNFGWECCGWGNVTVENIDKHGARARAAARAGGLPRDGARAGRRGHDQDAVRGRSALGVAGAAEIEAVCADVDDGLVEALMEFVLNAKLVDDSLNSEAMHHVSYTVPTADSSVVVTCRVASVFNEVGLKLWEAGWLLAEYAIAHESDFRGRTVLELGAGVGFSGMVLACVCRSSRIVLTDYAPNVMQNLRYNVEINASKFLCPVEVQTLDWETWQPTDHEDERPDVLLAGDCVYDVAAFPPLMHVLQSFLGHDQGYTAQHPQRVAIFAATIRNQKTFQTFLDQLAAHRIDYVDITASSLEKMGEPICSYPNRDQIRLCRLSRSVLAASAETK
ncbi:hypothetical protein ON010_g9353 [Phytophthora cinnamomi]|nr:hypothetical protein ON010_g9353 [Phytophthora cinnamomi]